jgi:hypothetical protein
LGRQVVAQAVGLAVAQAVGLAVAQSAVPPGVDQPAGRLPVSLVHRLVARVVVLEAASLAVVRVEAVVPAVVRVGGLAVAAVVVRAEARRTDRAARRVVRRLATLALGQKAKQALALAAARIAAHAVALFLVPRPQG